MTELPDLEQRQEESRRSDEDKYHELREEERAERDELSEGLDEDPEPRQEQ